MKMRTWLALGLSAATLSFGAGRSFAAHSVVESDIDVRFSTEGAAGIASVQQKCHDASNIWLLVSNFGIFGLAGHTDLNPFEETCGHDGYVSCQFPARGGYDYLFQGALWMGAIVGDDTLVSVGHDGWAHELEFFPGFDDTDSITVYSNIPGSATYDSIYGLADQSYAAIYTDTLQTADYPDVSPNHRKPLNVRVEQTSHALSFSYAEDFVIFDYQIENLGLKTLKDVFIGLYLDGDVGPIPQTNGEGSAIAQDDITGFRSKDASGKTINTAWIADYDGPAYRNPSSGDAALAPGVMAVRVVRSPAKQLKTSFNWWFSATDQGLDWGPGRPFPDGLRGTPDGDVNKYLIMSGWQNENLQSQYGDSLCVDVDCTIKRDPGQLGATKDGQPIAADDTRFLFSFGPFTIAPGEVLPFTLGYFCAEDFWMGGSTEQINYTDFDINARWVQFVFDNPGVDTKSWDFGDDGQPNTLDAGEADGIPDIGDYFFGEDVGPDGVPGTDDRDESLQLLEGNGRLDSVLVDGVWRSEDRALKYVIQWIDDPDPLGWLQANASDIDWEQSPDEIMDAFTVAGVKKIHLSTETRYGYATGAMEEGDGIPDFAGPPPPPSPRLKVEKPDANNIVLKWNDTPQSFADGFIPDPRRRRDFQGYRVYTSRTGAGSDFTTILDLDIAQVPETDEDGNVIMENGVAKMMADTLGLNTGFALVRNTDADSTEYPYAYRYGPLASNWPVYVAVTAYDNGYPPANLGSLESSVFLNATSVTPSTPKDEAGDLPVLVVPNPYKITSDYRGGWENDPDSWTEFDRRLDFTNLDGPCSIHIYTLAGDLVDTIEFVDTDDTRVSWDLISKNGQAVVSGIYLFSVHPDDGGDVEVGKFVIIK